MEKYFLMENMIVFMMFFNVFCVLCFFKKSNCSYDFSNVFCFFMIVMINKIYNTEMLTHGEH